MQAKETKPKDIIEGTKQYVLPLFQRSYSWEKKEWDVLCEDLYELLENENLCPHFIGSIVCIVFNIVDNPYLVFECLNSDGRPLIQPYLIKNYFFILSHLDHEYNKYN